MRRKRPPKSTCKPGSVLAPRGASDGHFSRGSIARPLQRSTRRSMADRADPRRRTTRCVAWPPGCLLLDLSPGGVCLAKPVTRPAGELLPHRFTLTPRRPLPSCLRRGAAWRSAFCCTFPGLTAGGRCPSPCPAEPGLSSRSRRLKADTAARAVLSQRPSCRLRKPSPTIGPKSLGVKGDAVLRSCGAAS